MLPLLLKFGGPALLILALPALGYWRGWAARDESAHTAVLEAQVLQNRDSLRAHERFAALTAALNKEKTDAQNANARYRAALADRSVRVSVPVVPDGGAPAAPGDRETRAELDPKAAADLDTIANDGDDAIRDLNACIDKYNAQGQ